MVRYNGRNKLLTAAVNGNQIGLNMGGAAPSVGRAISTRRYTKRRVRDNLKFCGPVYYRGQLWRFNSSNCVKKAPLRQSSAGGVGHINNPRKKCNINCSVDKNNIADSIKLIRSYLIHRFGEDGIVLVAPKETLQSDGINDVINGEKIYHFNADHPEYFTLPKKIRDAVDIVNNLNLKYRLKDTTDKKLHIVGYIAPSLQKRLRENLFGNFKEIFGNGANVETLYAFGYGVNETQLRKLITLFLNKSNGGNNPYPLSCKDCGPNKYNALNEIPIGYVKSMSGLFATTDKQNSSNFNEDISNWDTNTVEDMSNMFQGATIFNQDISSWDTSSVTNMKGMFANAVAFNQSLNNWNTSSVTNMRGMFAHAVAFNQSLNNWDTYRVTTMDAMFQDATAFNGDITAWNTSNVASMSHMFDSASSFNRDIGNWNTDKVEDMFNMFEDATAFNRDINTKVVYQGTTAEYTAWNTSKVTNMSAMFRGATSFNQPLSGWDTSSVEDMGWMFFKADDFNQDISNWKVDSVKYIPDSVFTGSSGAKCFVYKDSKLRNETGKLPKFNPAAKFCVCGVPTDQNQCVD